MTIFKLIEDNLDALKQQVYELEMNWVSGAKPSLHPQTAQMIREEISKIRNDIKSFDTRVMTLIERMKETITG